MKIKFTIPLLGLFFILLISTTNTFAQEKATIKGKITLNNNESPEKISVVLKGTRLGTVTDEIGNYKIKNVKPGSYTIKVSGVGYSAKEKNIVINEGQELIENFNITANSEELTEVVVNGGKTNHFARKENQQVSRLPLKNLENPQVYTTITGEVLKEQVVTNFDDALKNAPGVTQLWASTGRGGDGGGYYALRGFPVQPTMVNGLPGLTNGSLDPANVDKIEIIRGPSGTLFGSSLISYGGLINTTTKKPYKTFGGEINYTVGSYGLNRATVDLNTPLNDKKTLNFRVNSAYNKQNSFQDAGFRESFFIAPSLSYEVNDKLSFLVQTEFMSNESTNPTMLFLDRGAPLRVHNIEELKYDNNRSYTSDELTIKTPSFNIQAQMNYKLSDQWTSQTVFSNSTAKSDGNYAYLYEVTNSKNPSLIPLVSQINDGIVLYRQFSYQDNENKSTDVQQNFIGDFKIGSLRNRLVVGLDYYKRTAADYSSGYFGNGFIYIGDDLASFNAVFGPSNGDTGDLTKEGSDAIVGNSQRNNSKTKQEVYSAYFSDVLNILPNLSAMVSLRADRFMNADNDAYNQTAFSPKFGIVFQPILDQVSLFANYMNGFSNVSPSADVNGSVTTLRTFGPEHANQFEVGTKLNLFKDKFYATVSYYDIKVTDKVYGVRPNANDVTYYQDGAQENKGVEVEIVANPVNGLNIIAGYSYNEAILTKGDPDFVGFRSEDAGPRNLANLWASYKFTSGILRGFGLGFGGNYVGNNMIMHRATAGTFTIPEYTVLNSSLFYNAEKFGVNVKLNNLANKDIYDGWSTVHPKDPRAISASFTYRF